VGGSSKLYLLVDSGADVSLLRSKNLLGAAEFEPEEKIRIKSVNGSVIETHGSIEAKIKEGELDIPFKFQLVSKQIYIRDGILGRDFLQRTRAQTCYENRTLTLHYAGAVVHKNL
jgi:hypothetical protein